jgi:hypothetical protein
MSASRLLSRRHEGDQFAKVQRQLLGSLVIYPQKYKVGDLVAFKNRCQPGLPPFVIEDVDSTLFGDRYKLDWRDQWWSEGCFMPYQEWKEQCGI